MADADIENLERQIRDELEQIALSLHQKYERFVPDLLSEEFRDADKLESLHSKIGEKLSLVEEGLSTDSFNTTAAMLKELQVRLERIGECREVVERFSIIERNIAELRMLPDPADSAIQAANLIVESRRLLVEALQLIDPDSQLSRIHQSLQIEIADTHSLIVTDLGVWFKQAISFPQSHAPRVVSLRIAMGDVQMALTRLGALDQLGELDGRLGKVSTFIMELMVESLLSSGVGTGMVASSEDPVDTSAVIIRVKTGRVLKNPQDINPAGIFQALTTLFSSIAEPLDLPEKDGSGTSLRRRIGQLIKDPLMTAILKKVISVVSTVDRGSGDESLLKKTMEMAENFRENMINWDFMHGAVPTFASFAEQNERIFIDRKCGLLLARARDLIQQNYIELVTVGSGEEMEKETAEHFNEDFVKGLKMHCRNADQTYPKLFQLLSCKASKSVVELFELIYMTMSDAVRAEEDSAIARLALTGRNMLQLFLILTPRHHKVALSSVPQMAAVYYNNCYYLCHRVMMLTFDVLKELDPNSSKFDHFRPLFSDCIWQLRESAAKVLESLLVQVRRQLSALLSDHQLFAGTVDISKRQECDKTILACQMQVDSLACVWKEVLPETVYCKSLANVCRFFMDELFGILTKMEDIRTDEAEVASNVLSSTLVALEKHFVIRSIPMMQKECSSSYFRFKELIFILNGSLQGVDDRWCDGKGPLAECLKADEVRHLVRALFANTDQRKRLLERIY